jgi:hypothetical protein
MALVVVENAFSGSSLKCLPFACCQSLRLYLIGLACLKYISERSMGSAAGSQRRSLRLVVPEQARWEVVRSDPTGNGLLRAIEAIEGQAENVNLGRVFTSTGLPELAENPGLLQHLFAVLENEEAAFAEGATMGDRWRVGTTLRPNRRSEIMRQLASTINTSVRKVAFLVTSIVTVLLSAALLVGLLAFVAAEPAQASFPVKNGKIAFSMVTDGYQTIYLVDPDGSNLTRLTAPPMDARSPALSPDGTEIAFTDYKGDSNE